MLSKRGNCSEDHGVLYKKDRYENDRAKNYKCRRVGSVLFWII
mgnify:CR=1 FL=1